MERKVRHALELLVVSKLLDEGEERLLERLSLCSLLLGPAALPCVLLRLVVDALVERVRLALPLPDELERLLVRAPLALALVALLPALVSLDSAAWSSLCGGDPVRPARPRRNVAALMHRGKRG